MVFVLLNHPTWTSVTHFIQDWARWQQPVSNSKCYIMDLSAACEPNQNIRWGGTFYFFNLSQLQRGPGVLSLSCASKTSNISVIT